MPHCMCPPFVLLSNPLSTYFGSQHLSTEAIDKVIYVELQKSNLRIYSWVDVLDRRDSIPFT